MKKISKIFVMLLTVMAICISALPLTASAEGTTISLSKSTVSVGDKVTATIRITQKNLWGIDMTVNYNEQVLSSPTGEGVTGGAGVLKIVWDVAESVNSKTFTITFKAKKAGNCVISIPSVGVSAGAGEAKLVNLPGAAATVTVKDATKSNNANLSRLLLSVGSLNPGFSPSVTSYSVKLPNNITECKVYVETVDKDATVAVEGSPNMKVGDNVRVITVTAPSGNKKSYTLLITRAENDKDAISSTTSSETSESNPLDTVINGTSYRVMKSLKNVKLPTGFNVLKTVYNDEEISVATDAEGNFEIFYLTAAGSKEAVPYTYDADTNTFTKIKIINQNNNQYIVADLPSETTVNSGYKVSSQTIDGTELTCYEPNDEKMKGIFYLYCFFDGSYAMYRYDTVEKVLQRAPEFDINNLALQSGATLDDANSTFLDRFNALSSNAKTIVVCSAVALFALIILVVLLIVKAVRNRRFNDFDYDDEEFEEIQAFEDFKISDDDE